MTWLLGNGTKHYYLGHLFINRPTRRPNTVIDANVALNQLQLSNAKIEKRYLEVMRKETQGLFMSLDTFSYSLVARIDRTQRHPSLESVPYLKALTHS